MTKEGRKLNCPSAPDNFSSSFDINRHSDFVISRHLSDLFQSVRVIRESVVSLLKFLFRACICIALTREFHPHRFSRNRPENQTAADADGAALRETPAPKK